MKKIIIALLIISATHAHADENLINIELQNATLSEVLKLFLSQVVKRQYILHSEISSNNAPVNISLKNRTRSEALDVYEMLLSENDIIQKDVGNTLYLKKRGKDDYITDIKTDTITSDLTDLKTAENQEQPYIIKAANSDVTIYKPANLTPDELLKLLKFAGLRADVAAGHVLYENGSTNPDFIKALLKKFDGYNSDVVIKATVLEFQQTDKTQTAISAALDIIKNTLSLATIPVNFNATSLVLNLPNLSAVLKNITTNDNFNVLSSPTIRASHLKRAIINVGNEVPILTSLTQTNQGQPLQNVEYRSSGITLEVTPKIYTDLIEIDLVQSISDFIPTTNGVNSTPTLSQRKLQTSFKLKDGETVFIGGLNQTRDDKSKTSFFGVPTGKTANSNKTDLLLILNAQKI